MKAPPCAGGPVEHTGSAIAAGEKDLESLERQMASYGAEFLNLYVVPMSSAVWSTPPDKMLQFPARTLLRFFHNHGFLGLHTQHPWWTVVGGSSTAAITSGMSARANEGPITLPRAAGA